MADGGRRVKRAPTGGVLPRLLAAARRRRPPSDVLTAIRLLPAAGRWPCAAFTLLLLWNGLQGVLATLAFGLLVGAVPAATGAGLATPAGRRLLLALAAVATLFVLARATEPLQGLLTAALGRRYERLVQRLLLRAACRPEGIAHLDDAHVADRLAIARGEAGALAPSQVVAKLPQVVPPYVQAAGSAALLAAFYWWAPFLLAGGVVVERLWATRELNTAVRGMALQAGALRRAGYFRGLALEASAAKEVRIFGLGDWLLGRFGALWRQAMTPVWRERGRHTPWAVAALLASTGTYGVVAVMIALAALHGKIGIGRVAVFLGAAAGMGVVVWTADPEWGLRGGAQAVAQAVALDRELIASPAAPAGRSAAGLPQRELRFEAVSFRYPGAEREVLRGLDLAIPAGQSLAIVGLNGAGKTTLVQLLAGLYAPTAGRIVVDGVPLAELDLAAWRRRLAVIFQDFARYELSARANIGFGCLPLLHRRRGGDPAAEAAIERAVERAGATEVVRALPRGLDTVLSRRYRGGAELSGGQWQRIALARCLAAVEGGAGLLVLDEPTAALDVRAEAALFARFLELTRGLTTLLISHRFSTVRHAERIVVLEEGQVVEDGTHEALLDRGARYAALFHLQAARFREGGEAEALETLDEEAGHG